MKTYLPLLLLILSVLFLHGDQPDTSPHPGRYTLTPGDISIINPDTGTSSTLHTAYKLDTVTGRVWFALCQGGSNAPAMLLIELAQKDIVSTNFPRNP